MKQIKLIDDIISLSKIIYKLHLKLADIEIKKDIDLKEYKSTLNNIDLCMELEDKYYEKLENYSYSEIIDYIKNIPYLNEEKFYERIKYKLEDLFANNITNNEVMTNIEETLSNMLGVPVHCLNSDTTLDNKIIQSTLNSLYISFLQDEIKNDTLKDLKKSLINEKYQCTYANGFNPLYLYEPVLIPKINNLQIINNTITEIYCSLSYLLYEETNDEHIFIFCKLKSYLYLLEQTFLEDILYNYKENFDDIINIEYKEKIEKCFKEVLQKKKKFQ